MQRKTLCDFINKSNNIHNFKYKYSKSNYKNNRTEICITCKKHGDFYIKPYNHLKGKGCPSCDNSMRMNKKIFIDRSTEIHKKRYDYSLVEYKNNKTKVKIICRNHGEFLQRPNDHLMGQGCPECKKIKIGRGKKLGKKNFVLESIKTHGHLYDYTKVKYKRGDKKVIIICEKHGEFLQTPKNHILGNGCPKCKMSKGEITIMNYLKSIEIEYEYQKMFKYRNKKMFFDFFIPSKNICIEYDGQQHFKPIKVFGGEKRFNKQIEYDNIKNDFCKNNNITLIRIPFFKINKLKKIFNIYII